jgi:hypothetical protein
VICFGLFFSCLLVGLFGCTPDANVDPEAQAQRDRFLLKQEPAGPIGILEARALDTTLTDVVLYGRVKERVSGQAAFWINDPTADIHDHDGHDDDNCPYCKAKKGGGVDPTAIVRFVDDSDETLAFDSKDLLGIEAGQMVVVKGKAELDDTIGLLTVRADGVYIRQ